MSEMRPERPGVYSVYDASSVTSAGRAAKRIGVAALAVKGTANTAVTLPGYGAGVEAFGEDGADTPGMSTLLKLLFANGASTVYAVRVGAGGGLEAYQAAFAALANCDVQVVVCDSSELTIQKALKTAVETASAARGERIGVIGGSGDTAAELVTRAAAINSERMVLVGPDMKDENGTELPGVFAAAAVAGAIAAGTDPALPLNGAALYGIGGLQADYGDNDIDLMVRGGVTPLECVGGTVSPVRGITTRTKTGSAADATWRELTTVLVADDVIPAVRAALRSKFARAKNTAQGRGAIRAQTIVELDHRGLRRGDGDSLSGRSRGMSGGMRLCRGPRTQPDLPDGASDGLRRDGHEGISYQCGYLLGAGRKKNRCGAELPGQGGQVQQKCGGLRRERAGGHH
mgnify:CR=1 FL=1